MRCRISLVGRSAPLRCAQTKLGRMRSSSVPEYLDNARETTGVFGARDSDPRLSAASSSYPQRSSFAIPGLPGLARSLSSPWEVASGCTLRSAESCFEPPSSLLSWPEVRQELARLPDHSLMKVEPQKLEAFPAQIHQVSLGGVQSQLQLSHDPPNHLQSSLCLLLASADDHEVVGVSAESS